MKFLNFGHALVIGSIFLSLPQYSAEGEIFTLDQLNRETMEVVIRDLKSNLNPDSPVTCSQVLGNFRTYSRFKHTASYCHSKIQRNYNKTNGTSIYSLWNWEDPYEECTKNLDQNLSESSPELRSYMEDLTNRGNRLQAMELLCHDRLRNRLSDRDSEETGLMLGSGIGHQHIKLETLALQSLKGMNSIDAIMGKNDIKKLIECKDTLSEKVKQQCLSYQSCEKKRPKVYPYATLTLNALKAAQDIDELIDELRKKITTHRVNGPGVKRDAWEKRKELTKAINELRKNKEDLLSTVPWVNGNKFKEQKEVFEQKVTELRALEKAGDVRSSKSLSIERSLNSKIAVALTSQLTEDRKELRRRYDKALQGSECLYNRTNCKYYDEAMRLAPIVDYDQIELPGDEPIKSQARSLLRANQCLEDKSDSIEGVNEIAIDVASIGAGFLLGGYGGVARMAMVAAKFAHQGNRLRGIGAASMLAMEGGLLARQGGQMLQACQDSYHQMNNFEKSDEDYSCQAEQNMTLVPNFNKCLTEIAFLSVGIVAAAAPDIAKVFRASKGIDDAKSGTAITNEITGLATQNPQHVDNLGIGYGKGGTFRDTVRDLNIKPDELEKFKTVAKGLRSSKLSIEDRESFLVYFNSLSDRQQRKILENIDDFFDNDTPKRSLRLLQGKWLKKREMIKKYEDGVRSRLFKKYRSEGLSTQAAKAKADSDAIVARANYQKRKIGCSARKITPQHLEGAKNFTRFSVAMGAGSAGFGYASSNWDKPKDFDFVKDLGYELTMAVIMSKIGAKIMSNPTGAWYSRYAKGNAAGAAAGLIDAAIYGKVYGVSEKEADEKIEILKNSPQQMASLEKLSEYLDHENIIEKMVNHQIQNLISLGQSQNDEPIEGIEDLELGGEKFVGPLTDEMLENDAFKERLKSAILREIYESDSQMFNLGSVGRDKFGYDRVYNAAVGVPRAMLFGYLTYGILCRGANNQPAAISKAVGLQFLNQYVLGGYLYYEGRKEAIGR